VTSPDVALQLTFHGYYTLSGINVVLIGCFMANTDFPCKNIQNVVQDFLRYKLTVKISENLNEGTKVIMNVAVFIFLNCSRHFGNFKP